MYLQMHVLPPHPVFHIPLQHRPISYSFCLFSMNMIYINIKEQKKKQTTKTTKCPGLSLLWNLCIINIKNSEQIADNTSHFIFTTEFQIAWFFLFDRFIYSKESSMKYHWYLLCFFFSFLSGVLLFVARCICYLLKSSNVCVLK